MKINKKDYPTFLILSYNIKVYLKQKAKDNINIMKEMAAMEIKQSKIWIEN